MPEDTWRVLKSVDNGLAEGHGPATYDEVGTAEAGRYYLPPTAQEIGDKFGCGAYLLLRNNRTEYAELVVVAAPIVWMEQAIEELIPA